MRRLESAHRDPRVVRDAADEEDDAHREARALGDAEQVRGADEQRRQLLDAADGEEDLQGRVGRGEGKGWWEGLGACMFEAHGEEDRLPHVEEVEHDARVEAVVHVADLDLLGVVQQADGRVDRAVREEEDAQRAGRRLRHGGLRVDGVPLAGSEPHHRLERRVFQL